MPFVDLDRVFDFHYTTIGVISDTTKFERHVRSCGDWTIAWAKYKAAILFAFPHRGEELSIYGAHTEGTFLAIPAAPDLVLKYDIRVRTRVPESPRIRLSDLSLFAPDYMYFINAGATLGTLGGRSTVSTPAAQGRSSEICRRFNFGSCRDGGACRFRMRASNAEGVVIPSPRVPMEGQRERVKENGCPRSIRGFLWELPSLFDYVAPSERTPPLPSTSIANHPDTVFTLTH
jgi:hypothetical protein